MRKRNSGQEVLEGVRAIKAKGARDSARVIRADDRAVARTQLRDGVFIRDPDVGSIEADGIGGSCIVAPFGCAGGGIERSHFPQSTRDRRLAAGEALPGRSRFRAPAPARRLLLVSPKVEGTCTEGASPLAFLRRWLAPGVAGGRNEPISDRVTVVETALEWSP